MKTKLDMNWLIAALIRAIKTVAQTALGMISVGMAMNEIKWSYVISVSIVAGIYSILTSLKGLPEVGSDGTLKIDTSGETDIYRMELNSDVTELAAKRTVIFAVDPNANLSQD